MITKPPHFVLHRGKSNQYILTQNREKELFAVISFQTFLLLQNLQGDSSEDTLCVLRPEFLKTLEVPLCVLRPEFLKGWRIPFCVLRPEFIKLWMISFVFCDQNSSEFGNPPLCFATRISQRVVILLCVWRPGFIKCWMFCFVFCDQNFLILEDLLCVLRP